MASACVSSVPDAFFVGAYSLDAMLGEQTRRHRTSDVWNASYNMPAPGFRSKSNTARSAGTISSQNRADYFLRKRSSRTTSAPSPGFAVGSSLLSTSVLASATDAGTGRPVAAGTAGSFAGGVSATASAGSNSTLNPTDGSEKLLMALNGTTRRSGMRPNDSPTSKR